MAGETRLSPITAHRALPTLRKTGYVAQEKASGRYRLTTKLLSQAELTRFTPKTICAVGKLREDLERCRSRGYAPDWDEFEQGVRCVAAPFRNAQSKVIAAVGISSPGARITEENPSEFVSKIVAATNAVLRDLGASV